MSAWQRTALGNLAKFKAGNGFPKRLQGVVYGDFPFAKVSDMNSPGNEFNLRTAENYIDRETAKEINAFVHQPGSTAFAKIGVALTTNRRRFLNREVVLDNNMMSAAPNIDFVDPLYLYYLLCTLDFNEISAGSALPYLTAANLKQIKVSYPTIDEQQTIAATLGALDDKIELNRRMAGTLEEMARALYRSWFVDFDPVRARAAGLAPAHMDPATAALFPDRFGPDGLPEGWRKGTLGEVAEASRRGVDPGAVDPETPYIGLEHMPRRCLALGEWGEASKIGSQKSQMRRGEFLFGKLRPYFHKVGVAPIDGICSTDIIVVKEMHPDWAGFVLATISADEFIAHTTGSSSGTRMPRTNWKDMASYAVALPDRPVVAAFEEITKGWRERMLATIHESRTLAALRDALLPKLMSGEISVKTAEAQIEEVA